LKERFQNLPLKSLSFLELRLKTFFIDVALQQNIQKAIYNGSFEHDRKSYNGH